MTILIDIYLIRTIFNVCSCKTEHKIDLLTDNTYHDMYSTENMCGANLIDLYEVSIKRITYLPGVQLILIFFHVPRIVLTTFSTFLKAIITVLFSGQTIYFPSRLSVHTFLSFKLYCHRQTFLYRILFLFNPRWLQ